MGLLSVKTSLKHFVETFSGDVSNSRNAINHQVILFILNDVVWFANMHSEIGRILQSAYACWYPGTVRCQSWPSKRPGVSVTQPISHIPPFSQFFCLFVFVIFWLSQHGLSNITIVSDRCRHSLAVVTPAKCERNLGNDIHVKTPSCIQCLIYSYLFECYRFHSLHI